MKPISLLIFFLILTVSCSNGFKSTEKIAAVEKTDSCRVDSQHTYEVYIPERSSSLEKLPLLVIIDAHGNGKFALEKFKYGASHYPAILIASNLVKNGFLNYETAIQTLVEDVRQKYPAGETLFITGFSGGARMALGYALQEHVNGLILCGALSGASELHSLHCTVISISGTDDFNFMETAQYLFQEQSMPPNLKIELTNASHNWPDSILLSNQLGFLYLSLRQATDIPSPAKSELKQFEQQQYSRIDSRKEQGDILEATWIARNMSTTAPFGNDKRFGSVYNELKASKAYSSQLDQLKNSLQFEINARQPYLEAFYNQDSLWWQNEIYSIRKKIETGQNRFKKDMYKRITGFLGIACYSLGNQAIQERNAQNLTKIISVYRMLEPENSYVLYFSAFPYFWQGNNRTAISLLKKAKEAGFSDTNQMKNDFPVSITSEIN